MTAAIGAAQPPLVAGDLETLWRRTRLKIIYAWCHRRLLDLDRPRRFTEWVQWRKLYDHSPSLAALTDKLRAKEVVSAIAGEGLAVPTLWHGAALPETPPGPFPLVVKAAHGCNQYAIVRDAEGWDRARRMAREWMRTSYGTWLDEWQYRAARRAIMVEPFIGSDPDVLPLDYKVYVFGGRAAVVQVHVGRGKAHRWTQFDRDWKPLSTDPIAAQPPPNLKRMIETAERLAHGRDFLRVDFYDVDGRLWFGEFCLFPGSGLDPFTPDSLDFMLGALWAKARQEAA